MQRVQTVVSDTGRGMLVGISQSFILPFAI